MPARERYIASFDVQVGVNEVDDVVAFELLDYSEYELHAYVGMRLRTGRSASGWISRDEHWITLRH